MKSFVVGGGCFWCIDAVFRQFQGVKASVCGYAGGHTQNPDYRSVCSGTTGHHEVVRVDFDESVIDEDAILDIFFSAHDATSWDQQGADRGSQYRSVLLYSSDEQKAAFEAAKERAQSFFDAPVVTESKLLTEFWEAEGYHQDYYAKNPYQGYCYVLVGPKVAIVRKQYAHLLRD